MSSEDDDIADIGFVSGDDCAGLEQESVGLQVGHCHHHLARDSRCTNGPLLLCFYHHDRVIHQPSEIAQGLGLDVLRWDLSRSSVATEPDQVLAVDGEHGFIVPCLCCVNDVCHKSGLDNFLLVRQEL